MPLQGARLAHARGARGMVNKCEREWAYLDVQFHGRLKRIAYIGQSWSHRQTELAEPKRGLTPESDGEGSWKNDAKWKIGAKHRATAR